MSGGSDDSGRQADVYETYRDEGAPKVVRGSFYAWFTEMLAELLRGLVDDAMEAAWERPPLLTGELAELGVKDWLAVDSETVTLPDELAEIFPATSTAAGLKVHKVYSLGRNNIVGIEITPARDHDASVLDLLRGITAPPGRPRKTRQRDCPGSAKPYRGRAGPTP